MLGEVEEGERERVGTGGGGLCGELESRLSGGSSDAGNVQGIGF